MIKKITLENIKCFRGKHIFDFELKDLKKSQLNSEKNLANVNKKTKIMKAPLFFAKNATGKSTILEAIKVCMNFDNIQNYINYFISRNIFSRRIDDVEILKSMIKSEYTQTKSIDYKFFFMQCMHTLNYFIENDNDENERHEYFQSDFSINKWQEHRKQYINKINFAYKKKHL